MDNIVQKKDKYQVFKGQKEREREKKNFKE